MLVSDRALRSDTTKEQIHPSSDKAAATAIATKHAIRLAIPTAVHQIAEANDPIPRGLKTFMDSWKAQIPGMAESIQPERNASGGPHYISDGYTP